MITNIAAWSIYALGIIHTFFGILRFRKIFAQIFDEGFVNRIRTSDQTESSLRGGAFWFTFFGPLLSLVGHLAVVAAARGDLEAFRIIGTYMLSISVIGVTALPKSGFWATLALSPLLLAIGLGWIS